jgi:hypothetical protein
MANFLRDQIQQNRITFRTMSVPAKVLATCIILTLSTGMLGALGQIIVHDIIPTFYSGNKTDDMKMTSNEHSKTMSVESESTAAQGRGDLFSDLSSAPAQPKKTPFYKDEQFVWTLKWTHIHLFGMGMIFIFMGIISLLLDARPGVRTVLIFLPFIGVWIDIHQKRICKPAPQPNSECH